MGDLNRGGAQKGHGGSNPRWGSKGSWWIKSEVGLKKVMGDQIRGGAQKGHGGSNPRWGSKGSWGI